MEPPLGQLIQSLEQIIQQLKNLEVMFGSTAETYNQRKKSQWKSVVTIDINAPDFNKDDFQE